MASPDKHKSDHNRPEHSRDDDALLDRLALAMVNQPKASLNELAEAVGIGRTTLYRFCRTREELLERLFAYGASSPKTSIRHRRTARPRWKPCAP